MSLADFRRMDFAARRLPQLLGLLEVPMVMLRLLQLLVELLQALKILRVPRVPRAMLLLMQMPPLAAHQIALATLPEQRI